MREVIIEALKAKYFGVMKEAEANIEIYLESPVGIGEHPEIIDAIDSSCKVGRSTRKVPSTRRIQSWWTVEQKEPEENI